MKLLLKRLWRCKYMLVAFAIFLQQDNVVDRIVPALFMGFFGLEIAMQDLFEEYFGDRK